MVKVRPFVFIPECRYLNDVDYRLVFQKMASMGEEKQRAVWRHMVKTDLFFLLYFVLNAPEEINHPWMVDRINEVQLQPDGYLDLWAREHYKSTTITYALTIQDILNDPEVTIGIFSFKAPIAKGFLHRIMRELESNEILLWAFPDVLWENPGRDAPRWSKDDGMIVRRKGNPVEATVEAHGVIEGQPTSRHFKILIYDDIVTKEAISTESMVKNVINSWELSLNLGSNVGGPCKIRYIGTRYSQFDPYKTIIDRGAAVERRYPGTDTGTFEGEPVFWSRELMAKKIREMGRGTFAAQILQNPMPPGEESFSMEWLRYWPAAQYRGLNIYILCDPADSKKKKSDYTCFIVFGVGMDRNYYIMDIIRDKLSLTERANVLFLLHAQYHPLKVGYEKYGKDSDIQHFEDRMKRENYRFSITPLGGKESKNDRILSIEPLFRAGRVFLPERCVHTNYEKTQVDTVKAFVEEEYSTWPYCEHDDIFDCMARVQDTELFVTFPNDAYAQTGVPPEVAMRNILIQKKEEDYNPLYGELLGLNPNEQDYNNVLYSQIRGNA